MPGLTTATTDGGAVLQSPAATGAVVAGPEADSSGRSVTIHEGIMTSSYFGVTPVD